MAERRASTGCPICGSYGHLPADCPKASEPELDLGAFARWAADGLEADGAAWAHAVGGCQLVLVALYQGPPDFKLAAAHAEALAANLWNHVHGRFVPPEVGGTDE